MAAANGVLCTRGWGIGVTSLSGAGCYAKEYLGTSSMLHRAKPSRMFPTATKRSVSARPRLLASSLTNRFQYHRLY